MARELIGHGKEELPEIIAQAKSYASSVDDYGNGHLNLFSSIGRATFCGKTVPQELYQRALAIDKEHEGLRLEMAQKAYPALNCPWLDFEGFLKRCDRKCWDSMILEHAYSQGVITEEQLNSFRNEWKRLKPEYEGRLRANGGELKKAQNDYIGWLESILEED